MKYLQKNKSILFILILILLAQSMSLVVSSESFEEGIILTNELNIRETPTVDSKALAHVNIGKKVEILQYVNGWYKISYNSTVGWVNAWFVYVNNDILCKGIITGDSVNLRSKSNIYSNIVGTLDINSPVYVYGRDDNWYYIMCNGLKGWVYGNFLNTVYPTIGEGTIIASHVNIRKEPTTSSEILGNVPFGKIYNIKSIKDDWICIEFEKGETGYVFNSLMSIDYMSVSRSKNSNILNVTEPPNKAAETSLAQQKVITYAKSLIGVPYVWGGESAYGVDCSGFIKYVFKKTMHLNLLHRADLQTQYGKYVAYSDLKLGDVVFFDTDGGNNFINHVGIYLGNGQFIHASSSWNNGHQVCITNFSTFYRNAYMTARRYFD